MSVDAVSHWDGSVNFQLDDNGFLVMPDDITSIPRGAFSRNRNLRGIDLNNVRYVGERAFQECSNLETVIMRNVEAAGPESFGFCRSLRNVTFGRITDIGDSAFFYCGNLDIPEIPRSLVSVGSGAFSHTAVKRADLHWLREIPPSVFSYCTELEYADISGAAVIGSEAFLGCRSLTQVRLGGIEIIGAKAFRKCSSMVFTSLPDSLREIRDGAFCSVMPGIIIPENVTSFGRNCFGPPESRKSVKIYRSALHEFRNYFREDKVDQINHAKWWERFPSSMRESKQPLNPLKYRHLIF